jgi:hypothetical protein
MTVSSSIARVVHTANGSSVFFSSAPIQGLTASNVVVTLTDTDGVTTTQVLGTDYTLSSGGVTFTTAPAAGTIVTIRRIVSLLQPDQFETNIPFPAKTVENRFDQVVFGLQQAADDSGRAVRLHPSDTISGALPPAATRANKYLAFGPNGELTFPVPQPAGPGTTEAYWWGGTAGGTANALTLSVGGAPGSYAAGQRYAFVVAANNTGAATLAVGSLGAQSIRRPDGSTLAANDLVAGNLVAVTYDGTNFRLASAWVPLVTTFNADLTIVKTNPTFNLDKNASGQAAQIFGRTNGSRRWLISLGNTVAESGGNTGSNFVIRRYDDSGALLGDPITIDRASGAVTLTAPLTLPASDPTNANHAARKAYVDAGDRWVTLVDAAVTNSTTIDVTGFSLQNYRMIKVLLLGARLSSASASGSTTARVYRGGSLVTTGYDWQRLTTSGGTATAGNVNNDADVTLTFNGMSTDPVFMDINITQSASSNSAIFYANVFYNTTSAPVINTVAGRATGGSGWTDGIRITAPDTFQNNVGRIVVLGLKP